MENRLAPLVESHNWFTLSRFGGSMRFHWIKNIKLAFGLALLVLAVQVLEMVLAVFGVTDYYLSAQMPDLTFALALVFCCAFRVAKKHTTFLLRFGTPRTSVWLSNVLSLFVTGVCYLLLSCVVNALTGAAAVMLSQNYSSIIIAPRYALPLGEYMTKLAQDTFAMLPRYLLWLAEYTCIFYLLACCMRRWKAATIIVLVGVPVLFFTLLIMPTLEVVRDAVESGFQGEMMSLMFRFLAWFEKAGAWIGKNWAYVQGGAAVASLLLSYLVMRGTRQPE